MTLAQWAEQWPYRINHKNEFSAWTPDSWSDTAHRAQAWHLTDYRVSTVSGGSIWFYRRNNTIPE